MGSHTGRSFLNSCLKVPIDPCNNCPAPVYNRPKMYLGRLSLKTPTLNSSLKNAPMNIVESMLSSRNGVRSLAKFYDSIPDYCDINHLPEEEFYSTLDTLRTACRELKSKTPSVHCTLEMSSNSSSLSSQCPHIGGGSHKGKKLAKNKKKTKCCAKKQKSQERKSEERKLEERAMRECGELRTSCDPTPCNVDYRQEGIGRMRLKSFKEEFDDEIEEFKRTLKEFEMEFKRKESSIIYKTKSVTSFEPKSKEKEIKIQKEQTLPSRPTTRTSDLREKLRKSFSFNDLTNLFDGDKCREKIENPVKDRLRKKNELIQNMSKAETTAFKDRDKLSNYFENKAMPLRKERSLSGTPIPKIIVDSPSSDNFSSKLSSSSSGSRMSSGRKKKTKSKKSSGQIKSSFGMFDLRGPTRKENDEKSTPSPVHPVARPNLAATLRAEVSKKKLRELQNNCTYHDTTPQIDWEVRKTPAWKSLSLNESHKEILSMRLATRKAEQALQQREYELNMEMMRQRVKSAPLLLEGTTYWGPHVGKLTHTCRKDGVKHSCDTNQRKQRRKSCSDRREDGDDVVPQAPSRGPSRGSNKFHTLRKIYANSAKSYSRNSNRSRNSEHKQEPQLDSGDELSSVDRAYL